MSAARDLLHERSHSYLLQTRHTVELAFQEGASSAEERERAVTLGRSLFEQVSRILKLALDARDTDGFLELERSWSAMFEDTWIYDEPELRTPEQRDLAPLLRLRDVLRLGLAMWAAHLLASERAASGSEMWRAALQLLAGRFTTLEHLLDVYEDARERERSEGADWTSWFLHELPEGQAHFIPTSSELLFVTLLLAVRLVAADEPAPLRPRDWMRQSEGEVDAALERLERDSDRWSWFVGEDALGPAMSWEECVAALRKLLEEAQTEAAARERAELRQAPLDPDRVDSFRNLVLITAARERVLRDTFALQGSWEQVSGPPADHELPASRSWLPKSPFVPESQVVGIDHMARHAARDAAAEFRLLAKHLAELDLPTTTTDAPSVRDDVGAAIEELKADGLRPSLLLLPIAWRLKERLGLDVGKGSAPDHPLIPLAHRSRFAGLVDDVPAINVARMAEDRFYLLDLRAAASFVEWPSERDAGIDVTLRAFDATSARDFVEEHPAIIGSEQTADEVALLLEERVLLTMTLSWTLRPGDVRAVRRFAIPPELRRNPD